VTCPRPNSDLGDNRREVEARRGIMSGNDPRTAANGRDQSRPFAGPPVKTQTVLPSADTAAMLFWALLASGQINMRKVDGWHTLATKPIDQPIDLAA